MLRVVGTHQAAGAVEEFGAKVANGQIGDGALFGEQAQLAVDEPGELVRALYAVVAVFAAQENVPAGLVQLGAERDLYRDNGFAVQFERMREQQPGRVNLLRVVGEIREIGFQLRGRVGRDARDGAVIRHAQQDGSTIRIQEGADGLEKAARKLIACFLELAVQPFALRDVFLYLFQVHVRFPAF